MTAAVCRSFGAPLQIEQVTIRPPGRGEVLVRVAACAVCHSDVAFIDGPWGGQPPAIYGPEAAGGVAPAGPGGPGPPPRAPAPRPLARPRGPGGARPRGRRA